METPLAQVHKHGREVTPFRGALAKKAMVCETGRNSNWRSAASTKPQEL